MKNFNQQQGEMDSSEFYNNDVSKYQGANFDGNQKNGRHGSPMLVNPNSNAGNADYGGINLNNYQQGNDPNVGWEKKMGVFVNPIGTFNDISVGTNGFQMKEVDLSNKINCVGMPNESINGNSSDCGYGS